FVALGAKQRNTNEKSPESINNSRLCFIFSKGLV
ncbi:MAG: hypothetical protein ACI9HK_003274, partial [Pirellulaceae bacterium]